MNDLVCQIISLKILQSRLSKFWSGLRLLRPTLYIRGVRRVATDQLSLRWQGTKSTILATFKYKRHIYPPLKGEISKSGYFLHYSSLKSLVFMSPVLEIGIYAYHAS